MANRNMAFSPTDGLRNKVTYIVTPDDEDAAREQIQGRLDELRDHMNQYTPMYYEDAGSTDSYAITVASTVTAYNTGAVFFFKANTINTGACTLNITPSGGSALGAKTIKKNMDEDLVDGDVKAGEVVCVLYDGTDFQLLSPVSYNPKTNLESHMSDTTTHGTTGDIVGTSDEQTLTNKTISTGCKLDANADANITLSGWHRQAVINGNFGINQRVVSGTVVLVAGQYGHDRWKAGASGCTYTFATVENVTTITISAGSLQQVIEGINLYTGTYTLSWAGTSQGKIGAGSYGASGITESVTGGTNLTIEFNSGTLSKVQFNFGNVALPFTNRPDELWDCMRYCEKSYALTVAPGTSSAGSGLIDFIASDNNTSKYIILPMSFLVPKRTSSPTVTLYDFLGAANKITTLLAAATSTDGVTPTTGVAAQSNTRFKVQHQGSVAGIRFHFLATDEL